MDKDAYFDWAVYFGLIGILGSIPGLGSMRGHLLSRGATKKKEKIWKRKKQKMSATNPKG